MMAREKALGISFEMAEIGDIGEMVEIGPFICPSLLWQFLWIRDPYFMIHF